MAHFDPTNKQHVISAQGRKFITFVGLQAKLKDEGMSIIGAETELLQNGEEHESGRWIVRVTLHAKNRESGAQAKIQAIGDVNEANVGKMVYPAAPRMAETRAWVRAMRILTRSEYTAAEEIGGNEEGS